MFRKFLIIFSFLIIASAYTQEVKVFTLREAINEAFRNNTELVNARYDKLIADYKVTQTYNESLIPSLNVRSVYSRAFKKQVFDIFGQKFEVGTDNTINTTLELSQPIPILGTPIFQGINIAKYYSKLSTENVNALEAKVATEVKKSFLSVLLLKEVVEVNKKSLQNAQDNLNVVEIRYRNGTVTEFDYLRAKVKVESIKPELSKAESNLTLSKKNLKNTIGLKTDEDIDVVGSLIYDSTEFTMSIDDIINKMLDNNVSLRLLRINRQINEELLSIDEASYLPKFYVFGQYTLYAGENDTRKFFRYRYYNVVNAGIGMQWSFNLFTNPFKKSQTILEIKKTDEKIVDIKEKLKIQAQSIILRMEDAKKRINAQKETVNLAERGYELAKISFKNGVINQIDVLDAELTLTQSKLAYLQAVYEYLVAKAELEGLLEIK
ncbi:MAG: TolC family protein [Ignavibacteria bacterium]|nr:TolC family protein [Ignavibacteria bacterium]